MVIISLVVACGLSLAVRSLVSLFQLGPFKQFFVKWILFLQIVGETSKDFRRRELAEIDEWVIIGLLIVASGRSIHFGYLISRHC